MLALLMVVAVGTLFFGVYADDGAGIVGTVIIELITKLSKGLLNDTAASAVYGLLALVIVRIIQVVLSRIPTHRRTIIGKLVWRFAEILFGKDVALKNDAQATEDPAARENLKEELKKRFPILDLKIKGE